MAAYIIIAIIALSAFLGYRKGFVTLAIKFFAFIIAIAITFIIYKRMFAFIACDNRLY